MIDILAALVLTAAIAIMFVWAAKHDEKCPMCDGSGKRQSLDGREINCAFCYGKGTLDNGGANE